MRSPERVLPLSPCGRGWLAAKRRHGRGGVSTPSYLAVEFAERNPSPGASRHLLPQGEKGRKRARSLRLAHHGLQIIIRLDDFDQAILGGAVATVGIGVVLLHQRLVLGLDVGERGPGAEDRHLK